MQKTHCSGCGRSEMAGQPETKRKIKPVTLVLNKEGTRSWDAAESYNEDLCDDCVKRIVTSFFGVRGDNLLDPPIMLVPGVAV